MSNIVLKRSATDEDQILSVAVSPRILKRVDNLREDLYCVGETEESIRLSVLVNAARTSLEDTQAESSDTASLHEVWEFIQRHDPSFASVDLSQDPHGGEVASERESSSKPRRVFSLQWIAFEKKYVLPELDRLTSRVTNLLEEAFRSRLSESTRKRLEEMDNGDKRFPVRGGQVHIKITKRKLKRLLNLSDTLFGLYERNEFLPALRGEETPLVDKSMSREVAESVLTVQQAAGFLKLSESVVRRNIKRHTLPFFRVGRRYLLSRPALESWIAERIVHATQEPTIEQIDLKVKQIMEDRRSYK